ncbi:MAG: heat shock protein, partial [Glaciihabitans sp.]|nr:heat shock protein [Glaciihabitans sp.]
MAEDSPGTAPIDILRRAAVSSVASSAFSALSYGRAGGLRRAQYLMRSGNTADVVPPDVRQFLMTAVAEEEAARVLSSLGVAFTVWHDVATDADGTHPDQKIDHVVLGPNGVFAVLSADWGARLRLRRGELVGKGLRRGEKPIRTLYRRAQAFARTSGIRFSALVMVVPDDAVSAPLTVVSRRQHCPTLLVRRSWLPDVLHTTVGGIDPGKDYDVLET